MKRLIFLILALAFCSAGFAQDNQNKNRQDKKEKFEQMMAEIQSRKIAFFTKHLKLTSEEAKVFWPVYEKCEAERNAARKEIRKSAWTLHKAVKEGNASDEEIRSMADTYYENLDREASLQKLHYYEYLKVLPVKKAAMVRVVEERFMNELLSQWRRQSGPKDKDYKK
ncbi:MAG: hypothetical protein II157_04275 [Bacteroidales bacterium]|nr:hypothetical protein [Bacteroidales bacterium]